MLAFDDAFVHAVENTGPEARTVLLVNVWKPVFEAFLTGDRALGASNAVARLIKGDTMHSAMRLRADSRLQVHALAPHGPMLNSMVDDWKPVHAGECLERHLWWGGEE